jgi:hypothetical protein
MGCLTRVRPPASAQTLPSELLLGIFAHLSAADRARAGATCTHWRRCANDERAWRDLYARDLFADDLVAAKARRLALPHRPPVETRTWRDWYDQHQALDLAARREASLTLEVRDLEEALNTRCAAIEAARASGVAAAISGGVTLIAGLGAPGLLVGGGLYAGGGAALLTVSAAVGAGFVGLGLATLGGIPVLTLGFSIAYHGMKEGLRRVAYGALAGAGSVVLAASGATVASVSAAVAAASGGVMLLAAPGLVYRVAWDAGWRRPALQNLVASQSRVEAALSIDRAQLERVRTRWLAANRPRSRRAGQPR